MESHERKIERAHQHLQALRAIAPPEGSRNVLIRQYDDHTGDISYRLADLAPFSVLVGDALQNLKSGLDHLVYELLIAQAAGRPIDPKVIERSEFPIFWTTPKPGEIAKKIGGIDPRAQTIIERLQPHLLGPDYVTHPLWQLHELARMDRHRSLLPGAFIPQGWGLGGNVAIETFTIRPGISEPGAVLASGRVWPVRRGQPMGMDFNLAAQVVFRDGPCVGQNPVTVLTDLDAYIAREITAPLSAFFGPTP